MYKIRERLRSSHVNHNLRCVKFARCWLRTRGKREKKRETSMERSTQSREIKRFIDINWIDRRVIELNIERTLYYKSKSVVMLRFHRLLFTRSPALLLRLRPPNGAPSCVRTVDALDSIVLRWLLLHRLTSQLMRSKVAAWTVVFLATEIKIFPLIVLIRSRLGTKSVFHTNQHWLFSATNFHRMKCSVLLYSISLIKS